MALNRIVEHLDKIKYLPLASSLVEYIFRLVTRFLNVAKKAFCDGIIITIHPSTHRRYRLVLVHEC